MWGTVALGTPGWPAPAPRCLTWNQVLCPEGRPLPGGHPHHGAQSPGSFTLLPSPVLASLTACPPSTHRCGHFNFPFSTGYLL